MSQEVDIAMLKEWRFTIHGIPYIIAIQKQSLQKTFDGIGSCRTINLSIHEIECAGLDQAGLFFDLCLLATLKEM